jgi:hypothetical protein
MWIKNYVAIFGFESYSDVKNIMLSVHIPRALSSSFISFALYGSNDKFITTGVVMLRDFSKSFTYF